MSLSNGGNKGSIFPKKMPKVSTMVGKKIGTAAVKAVKAAANAVKNKGN